MQHDRTDLGGAERGLLELTDAIYDAAAGPGSWSIVGERLTRLFGAGSASIMAGTLDGSGSRILYHGDLPLDAVAAYRAHYRTVDLWTTRAAAAITRDRDGGRTRVFRSGTLVPDAEFVRSEFYADFGRLHGLRYVVGTVIPIGTAAPLGDPMLGVGAGAAALMPIGLHRPPSADPFEPVHARMLDCLVPHLRRAMLLADHLRPSATAAAASGLAALEALAAGVVVVDMHLGVGFANGAAEALAGPDGPIRLRRSGRPGTAVIRLEPVHRGDLSALSSRVRAVAIAGGAGGAVGLRDGSGAMTAAALVAPLPARLAAAAPGQAEAGRAAGLALVLLRDIRPRRPRVHPGLLCDLFGLTAAEADVAVSLAGGVTKEAVAKLRGARVSTVRTQVRALLGKTGATNLRDLERILATLG